MESFPPVQIHAVSATVPQLSSDDNAQLKQVLARHEDVIGHTAGKLISPPVKMHLKPGATPVFARTREIPYALRETYAKEIDTKIAFGQYKRVYCSEWASPTHVVLKRRDNTHHW